MKYELNKRRAAFSWQHILVWYTDDKWCCPSCSSRTVRLTYYVSDGTWSLNSINITTVYSSQNLLWQTVMF